MRLSSHMGPDGPLLNVQYYISHIQCSPEFNAHPRCDSGDPSAAVGTSEVNGDRLHQVFIWYNYHGNQRSEVVEHKAEIINIVICLFIYLLLVFVFI